MKKINLLLILVCLCFSSYAFAQNNAEEILAAAVEQAQSENKNVLLSYTASWCGWCKKMEDNMKSEDCHALFDSQYVLIKMNVLESKKNKNLETPAATEMMEKMGGKNQGIPFWVIIDGKGNVITNSLTEDGTNLGCPATEEEVEEFVKKLAETSNLTKEDLNVIAQKFLEK